MFGGIKYLLYLCIVEIKNKIRLGFCIMKFTIGIKPTIIRGSGTLRQAKERINGVFSISSTYGSGYIDHIRHFPKCVYGYNIEVFKRGKYRKDKHYVIYRYEFPIEIFQLLNVEIKQGSRTFKIVHK